MLAVVGPIHDAIAVTEAQVRAANATIRYDPPGVDIWVTGGHIRLQQVLVNLIGNALDAMEGQEDQLIEISVNGPCVTLRDTGPGIETDAQGSLFDPFFTTKAPGKGMGLGLSISYNIVSDFGGTLTAANHPQGGAIFTLTLQACEPTDIAAQ